MKKLLILAFALLPLLAHTQTWYSMLDMVPDSGRYAVGTHTALSVNSFMLTSRFTTNLVRGGQIEPKTKNEVLERMNNNSFGNLSGGNLDVHLFAGMKLDSLFGKATPGLRWFARASDRQYASVVLGEDVFELAFYGNRSLAGDTARIAYSAGTLMRYQQAMIGFVNETKAGRRYGAGLSYVNGEQYLQAQINNGWLYTSPTGAELSAALNGRLWQSDTSNTGFAATNGMGMALDAFYEFDINQFDTARGPLRVRFALYDAGFIQWNNKTLEYAVDSTYHYAGFSINSLSDLQDSVLSARADSVADSFTYRTGTGYTTSATPARIVISAERQWDKLVIGGGIDNRFDDVYQPYAWLRPGYKLGQYVQVNGVMGWSGYGTFSFGADVGVRHKNVVFALGTSNFEGVVFPGRLGGIGAWTTLRVQF